MANQGGLFLCIAIWLAAVNPVDAQEGHFGEGHESWHQQFYSGLQRPDGKGSCCNLFDCRSTSVRSVDDHYEVMKDGRWVPVPMDKIIKKSAPDGGAHICAPQSDSKSFPADEIFCVILPFET